MQNRSLFTLLACLAVGVGCEPQEEKRAAQNAEARANPAGAGAGARRCGDFISEEEARELGVEEYRANKGDTNPLRGVVCTTHPVVVTVFMAPQYPTMIRGAKSLKDMKESSGPALGKETFWFEALEAHQVMFVSKSGNYAFGVSGPDKALVEKAARMAADGR